MQGITLESFPAYTPQSNGKAKRLVRELSLSARVMLTNTIPPDELWAEAMHRGNWLRNSLPSKSIGNHIPFKIWKLNANIISFTTLLTCGQLGYAFIYRVPTSSNKKLAARSMNIYFVGMESDEGLCKAYDPMSNVCILFDFGISRPVTRINFQRYQDHWKEYQNVPKNTLTLASKIMQIMD